MSTDSPGSITFPAVPEPDEEARQQAQSLLPDLARDELPDGELHTVACEVRDGSGRIVYRGRLTYEGVRL